jgi:hypothetical protein
MVAVDQLDVLNANDRHVASERLYRHLLPEIAPELADRLAAGRYHGQLARTMLGLLVELAPNVALETCWTLARGNGELASDARQRLAVLDPTGAVNEFSGNSAWTESLTEVAPRLRLDALDASHLALLARLLLTRFAIHDDPPPLKVGAGVNAERETRAVRDRALLRLADEGDVDALQALATEFPNDRPIFATLLRDARRHAADLAFTPVTPNGLVAPLDQGEARLVRHDRDLVDVVIEQLDQIQQDLRTGAYRDVWNLGNDPRPKSEDDISDWLKRQLSLRMTHGLIVDRETQVMRRQQQGIGTRIDLAATATTSAQPPDVARVIIEAKLINNRQLLTSLQRQLVDRYLVPSGQRHGIYLVYWVDASQRPAAWQSPGPSDRDELREQLDTQASNVGNSQRVAPYILDVSRSHHPDSA